MGLTSAINASLSGLKATQVGLDVAAANIANAGVAGYTRRVVTLQPQSAGEDTYGVRVSGINRALDERVQTQLRASRSTLEYAGVRADGLSRLNALYGGPTDPNAITSVYAEFLDAMEALATTPDGTTQRMSAVSATEGLAGRLNGMSSEIQALRQDAEDALAAAVDDVNALLGQISRLEKEIVIASSSGGEPSGLLDQRDAAIEQLSRHMDIRVEQQAGNAVAIHTSNGALLFDDVVSEITFEGSSVVGAGALWSPDPARSALGSVGIRAPDGQTLDLFADRAFRSGGIVALKSLRDDVLVEAQAQLDALAAAMARSISEVSRPSVAYPTTASAGRAVDVTGLAEGNTVRLALSVGGVSRTVTLVNAAAGADVGDDYTPEAGDQVLRIDFSDTAGLAAAVQAGVAAIDPAFGTGFTFGYAAGALSVVPTASGTVDGLTTRVTASGTQDGVPQLQLFTDGSRAFTGLSGGRDQTAGFAARIRVNAAISADPALLVASSPATAAGDAARPRAIVDALQTATTFSPVGGIGSVSSPYRGTITAFLGQVVSTQGATYASAQRVHAGEEVVTNNLAERMDETSGVSIDDEMARLIQLQTSFQANARVIAVVQEMIDALLRI